MKLTLTHQPSERGTGLAGLAERRGADRTARALGTTGRTINRGVNAIWFFMLAVLAVGAVGLLVDAVTK